VRAARSRDLGLTGKGRDLWPVMMSLMKWSDRYEAGPEGPPRLVMHRDCGGDVTDRLTCAKCGAELTLRDVETRLGPGARVVA
jgi:hypothetical protein